MRLRYPVVAAMPDRRQHRGPHPRDEELFAPGWHPVLRQAASELSWLLGRGYSDQAGLKLVGDRHQLRDRQRLAIRRGSCAEAQRIERERRQVGLSALEGRTVHIDGFNALITAEVCLSRGLVLVGRDGAHRDLAGVHSTYRRVEETQKAACALGGLIALGRPARVRWLLDRPVSNSGRLRQILLSEAHEHGWYWEFELPGSVDRALEGVAGVVASSDSSVMDHAEAWIDLPGALVTTQPAAWILDLRGGD